MYISLVFSCQVTYSYASACACTIAHTYIHTYIHTGIINTYIRTYIITYIHTGYSYVNLNFTNKASFVILKIIIPGYL